jgi:hypothetical protein
MHLTICTKNLAYVDFLGEHKSIYKTKSDLLTNSFFFASENHVVKLSMDKWTSYGKSFNIWHFSQ